jgi:hypothetical protein
METSASFEARSAPLPYPTDLRRSRIGRHTAPAGLPRTRLAFKVLARVLWARPRLNDADGNCGAAVATGELGRRIPLRGSSNGVMGGAERRTRGTAALFRCRQGA